MQKLLFIFLITFLPSIVSAQIESDKEIALVFSGGGGRGAYEIGVWKALTDLGYEIRAVYGSSVGAVNGPAVIMGDYNRARDLWLDASYLSVMDLSWAAETLLRGDYGKLTFGNYITVVKELRKDRGIDVTPLKTLLNDVISEEEVRSSKIDYGLVILSVSNLEPKMLYIEQIPQGELVEYILASANFPLFTRQEIEGEVFIDGGLYSNVPIEMAIKRGFKNIVVVDIALQTPVDLLNSFKRHDDSLKLTYISPRDLFGSALDVDPEISRKYLIEGYLDTMKEYGYLHGEDYYIYGSEDSI